MPKLNNKKIFAGSSLVIRLVLGAIWLVAGLIKLLDLNQSIIAVRAYHLLPYALTTVVGYGLPIIEVLIGILLLAGLRTRIVSTLSAILFVVFIFGIASVWYRGIAIDCGCFGGGGENANAFANYPWEIARDVLLAGCSVFLIFYKKPTLFSVDSLLKPIAFTELKADQMES